ncbi:MAG: xanthine dehydrogenase family protein subunit M [Proteobacteria bacterium]|nr:xanthine dehydrogenase family protein subunit M [Pseudomonadota bacterium]NIS70266.1 xanthine dehydrogenase family protein subunit M [Pseudomonadota bacterium]
MLLPKFTFHEPETLDECLSLLDRYGSDAAVLAGGTDLLVNMKKGLIRPSVVVSLSRVGELQGISTDGDSGKLRLGSMVTMDAIATHQVIKKHFSILAQGAQRLGSPLIRNRATIGGNLVTARPAADSHGPLICLGAQIELTGPSGSRKVPVEDFFQGPGTSVRRSNEVLTQITIDKIPPKCGGVYLKYGIRKTLEISVVNVSVLLCLEKDKTIAHARVALGAVSPKTIRSPDTERCLIGNPPDEKTLKKAAEAAAARCQPISDIRGSAEYRQILVEVLTRRGIEEAARRALSRKV